MVNKLEQNRIVKIEDWGLTPYALAWERQKQLQAEILAQKLQNRERSELSLPPLPTQNYLIFTEHEPVYTMGKSGKAEHLLDALDDLPQVSYYAVERGGDVTFHGPGQIVGYPLFDLENFFTDLHLYMRSWEETIIRALAEFSIVGDRLPGATGVWLEPQTPRARKIAAMGIKCSRWVTMHGFALNVNVDLSYFSRIVPCGIVDKGVTSMALECGRPLPLADVKDALLRHARDVWQASFETSAPIIAS